MLVLKVVAILLVSLYLAIVIAMYAYQDLFLYRPNPNHVNPQSVGLSGVQDIPLKTSDGENIYAWYAPAKEGAPTILFFHGNAGSIANRADRLSYYQARGYGALFLEYRGFGGNSGQLREVGLIADADAAYAWLIDQGISPQDILLSAESLGTGIATITASRHPAAALSLQAPYSSIADVAADKFWALPVRLLIKDNIDAETAIKKIHVSVLIQHGDADIVIPIQFGQKLFAAANEPKQFVLVPGGGHQIIFDEQTWQRELAFFAKYREIN